MLTRTTVTIPEELMLEVDRLAGPRGRSAFVSAAVEEAVKRERLRLAIEDTRSLLAGSDTWGTPDDVYRWVREQRIDRHE
jgi:hypothetical protein